MSRHRKSLPSAYFDALYARDPDPWKFETSDYEREKYEDTLTALPRHRYRRCLEVGCSIGILTRLLAQRCDELIAMEPASEALSIAKARCADLDHVSFAAGGAPDTWPSGRFDLIMLSEVVYYLDRGDVQRLVNRVTGTLLPRCDIVLVHWTGKTNYPLSGDEASDLFIAGLSAAEQLIVKQETIKRPEYRLDVLCIS